MTDEYNVTARVEGDSLNQVVSKLMLGAYLADYELVELEVELAKDQHNVLFYEDVDAEFTESDAPAADNDPTEVFRFPHVTDLIDGLKERRRNNG